MNGHCSTWEGSLSGVLQGSIRGHLFFLIFINDLPNGLKYNVKMIDDASLFLVITDILRSSNLLIEDWAFQWKMLFNPDPSKKQLKYYFLKQILILHIQYILQ